MPASKPVVRKGTNREGSFSARPAALPSAQAAKHTANIISGITTSISV